MTEVGDIVSIKRVQPGWKKRVVSVAVLVGAIVIRGTISLIAGENLKDAVWEGGSEINIMNMTLFIALWYDDEIREWWEHRTDITSLNLQK